MLLPLLTKCFVLLLVISTHCECASSSPWIATKIGANGVKTFYRIFFVNEKVGWISADENTLLKTIDAGISWTTQKTNLMVKGSDVSSVWFHDENYGFAVGSIDREPTVWMTKNGGTTWAVQAKWERAFSESLGTLIDVTFADRNNGWAVGFNGFRAMIVATRDGGRHWEIQYSGNEISGQFNRIDFSDTLHGIALSFDGAMQTNDGGKSWRLQLFEPATLNSVTSIDSKRAWVAGAWGSLMRMTNGSTWNKQAISGDFSEHFFGYVKFINADNGWLSGTKCDILRTQDAGTTWVVEHCPLTPDISDNITTGEMAITRSKLFMIANPGYIFIRSVK